MSTERPLPDASTAGAIPEVPFYISATGPAVRPRRTLKHADTFVVLDSYGDIGVSAGGSDGLFHLDTRFLSRFQMVINGVEPLLLGSNLRDDNAVLSIDLTNPDIYFDQHLVLEKDTLHIGRTVFLWRDTAYQRFAMRNHGARSVELVMSFTFDGDFADVFEVRGMRRPHRGIASTEVSRPHRTILKYTGLDGKIRTTVLHFDPPPTALSETAASYKITLAPHESISIFVAIQCDPQKPEPVPFLRGLRKAQRDLRGNAAGAAVVETSNQLFNEVLCRSMADLSMLITNTPQGPYPYAGIPWYSTTFGRDGILTALQMLWVDPRIARGVLRRLAALQAKTYDASSDAAPGKILHETRAGEMAALGEVPFGLYYGSVDSTPLFVLLAGLFFERTGDEETLNSLWPALEAAVAWMDGPGDPDGDGFVEYARATPHGLVNQGWKDSFDAVFHADGRLAEGPIALAEVQAYVFAAKQLMARCAFRLGHSARARELESQAGQLAEQFNTSFWSPELGMYALALAGDKEPCLVRTSNAGHALFTGIVPPDRAQIIAQTLMSPEFFSGWGIRTVSQREHRYNPMSYHNGSIWPHDNAIIALGLAKYGLTSIGERLFKGLFDAAGYMDFRRLPELFCGFKRSRARGPTLYPVACSPQAWAAATPFALLQASLGLELDPVAQQIRLRNPRLPTFLDNVVLRNLQLGGATADLAVQRNGNEVSLRILRTQGNLQVSVIYSK